MQWEGDREREEGRIRPPQNSGKSNVHAQHHAMWTVKGMDQDIISSLDLIPTQTMCVILGNLSFLISIPSSIKEWGLGDFFKVLSILKILLFYYSKPVNWKKKI